MHKKPREKRKWFHLVKTSNFVYIFAALSVLALVSLAVVQYQNYNRTPSMREVVGLDGNKLVGDWRSDEPVVFLATISETEIIINMRLDESSNGLYWKGTFTAPSNGEVVSNADRAALGNSLYGSQDQTKRFIYRDDTLSYTFKMLGVERTIKLHRV